MLTVVGNVYVPEEMILKKGSEDSWFCNMVVVSKNHRKIPTESNPNVAHVYHNLSIVVGYKDLPKVKEMFRKGALVQIRQAYLDSIRTESGAIYSTIRARIHDCSSLTAI